MIPAKKGMDIVRSKGQSTGMIYYNNKTNKNQVVLLPFDAKYKNQRPMVRRLLQDIWIAEENEKGVLIPKSPVTLVPCTERSADVFLVYSMQRLFYKLPRKHKFVTRDF